MLRLDRYTERAEYILPGTGAAASCEIEIRIDPMSGTATRINRARRGRPKQQESASPPEHANGCPFCPGNLESATPTFPKDFYPKGRIREGRAVVFPNMYPLSSLHVVVVFTPEHRLEIQTFTKEEIAEGILASASFIRLASERGRPFHFLGWNHLSQAGASILHPHFQAIAGESPVSSIRECLASSMAYRVREGRCFWEEFLEAEVNSPRYVGRTNGFSWIAPWAPMGACEVIGVSDGQFSSILELETDQVFGLADGISRVLKGYWSMGLRAVTMGVYSLPPRSGEGAFRLHVRIMARSRRIGCDRAFLELYGWEVGLTDFPEEYAAAIRGFF